MSLRRLRPSVLGQLQGSRRFWLLMALLLAPATSLGAKEVARLEYVTDVFGSAAGIGSVGVTIALAIAVAGAVAGPLADRTEPRALLLLSLGAVTLSNFATAGLLAQGLLSAPMILALAAVDGLALGMGAPALVKVLAAMVPVDARGSAEIVNIFRLSAGGIAGLLLANASPSVVVTMLGCGIGATLGAAGVAVIVKPTRHGRRLAASGPGSTSLLATLRDMPSLRYVVIADLVLTFTIPTQLSNVILADEADPNLVVAVLLAGVVGVMVGRLGLVVTGSLGAVRRQLLVSFGIFATVAFIAWPLTASGAILAEGRIAAGFILVGSASTSYVLGLLAALVQQQVPDDVRGALTGFMAASRSLLIAGAAALITAVIVPLNSAAVVLTVCVLAVVALAVVRGFRGISARPN